ncbi:hypothetical protein [Kitasatospora sp. NPDC090091]|uniref:hypothetical protein n=1 Tax=Kitasatospora sp. NPDC090091 TaxID=3364081 RepID=UPI003825BD9C
MKSLPPQQGGSPLPRADDAAAAPPTPEAAPPDDGRRWAGDPYDEGDEVLPDDPSVTARFSAQDGEEAWLERSQDGTLTGWLRDPSGQVYRYSDPDAWAVDVDDAGMAPAGGASGPSADDEANDLEDPEPDGEDGLPDELEK